ncbi:MAG: AraC family transcriptional regulator [Lachnospiraceae bacterium]|nr:AraC family transcriptional regulator [Lachnospiraceae bacterium]
MPIVSIDEHQLNGRQGTLIRINEHQLEEIQGMQSSYPYVLHRVSLKWHNIPWHWHAELEIAYIISGTLNVHTTTGDYTFSEGEAFFMNTNVLASMDSPNGCILESHHFHAVFLTGHFHSIYETKYINPIITNKNLEILEIRNDIPRQAEILSLLREASKLQEEEDTEMQTRNVFSSIWLLLLKNVNEGKVQKSRSSFERQERLLSMLSYIHQNYHQKITLDEIAEHAAISKRECQRCFQNGIRKSPSQYIMEYRLEKAKEFLHETDLPITEITFQTGFYSASYFGKMFKEHTGMSPLEYRKQGNA